MNFCANAIVGLSHTLNIGASNKLRVAKDSSEYVGEDKEVEIGGNLNTSIKQDESRNVGGNKREVIQGSLDINVNKDINIFTESNSNFTTQGALDLFSNTNSNIQAKEQISIQADNTDQFFQTDYSVNAGNTIIHQVGDTSITAKGDCVIIKAGGVEVVIDSKGLVVKGGEVKSE